MAQVRRSRSIKAIANQQVEESLWGVPESPEFSAVQRLMNEFQTHEGDEERWLRIYKTVAAEAEDPVIRLLLNLIIADEDRHHQLIGRMISTLKDDLASTSSKRSALRRHASKKKPHELRAIVERLLEVERRGIREYERLHQVSRGLRQDLCGLLCKTMIHDSQKHVGILEFLRMRLGEPKPGGARKNQPEEP
jgi:rubrerythrin